MLICLNPNWNIWRCFNHICPWVLHRIFFLQSSIMAFFIFSLCGFWFLYLRQWQPIIPKLVGHLPYHICPSVYLFNHPLIHSEYNTYQWWCSVSLVTGVLYGCVGWVATCYAWLCTFGWGLTMSCHYFMPHDKIINRFVHIKSIFEKVQPHRRTDGRADIWTNSLNESI